VCVCVCVCVYFDWCNTHKLKTSKPVKKRQNKTYRGHNNIMILLSILHIIGKCNKKHTHTNMALWHTHTRALSFIALFCVLVCLLLVLTIRSPSSPHSHIFVSGVAVHSHSRLHALRTLTHRHQHHGLLAPLMYQYAANLMQIQTWAEPVCMCVCVCVYVCVVCPVCVCVFVVFPPLTGVVVCPLCMHCLSVWVCSLAPLIGMCLFMLMYVCVCMCVCVCVKKQRMRRKQHVLLIQRVASATMKSYKSVRFWEGFVVHIARSVAHLITHVFWQREPNNPNAIQSQNQNHHHHHHQKTPLL